MISACYARVASSFSWLKLQAIINAQIDTENCKEWGLKISKTDYYDDLKTIHSIHNRMINESDVMLSELQYSALRGVIISFTALLEQYLKDSIKLNMMRNSSLLLKGLHDSKTIIEPNDLLQYDDVDSIKMKYINNISVSVCSGELWKEKIRKYVKFMSLNKELSQRMINNKIESVWKVRNDITHANTNVLTLEYEEMREQYSSSISAEEYIRFSLFFVELVDETIDFLSTIDKLSLDKWETTDDSLFR